MYVGALPVMTYMGGSALNGYLFQASGIHVMKMIGISQVEVYERVGKSGIRMGISILLVLQCH